jgi:hypothetical protein
MPQMKGKQEEYNNLGGINTKASEYTTGLAQFLDLQNVNFSKPGALTKRDGSTLYVGATIAGKITGLTEYEKLDGSSYVIASANTNLYSVTSVYSAVRTGLANDKAVDFQTFNNVLFACNGTDFFKWNGSSDSLYSLPPGMGLSATLAIGGSLAGGTYFLSYGYLNDAGYFGPSGNTQVISISGSTFLSIVYTGLTMPTGYGVSALAFYRSSPGSINLFRTFTTGFTTSVTDSGASALTANPTPPYIHFTFAPKMLTLYNNQLMMAGVSAALSTVFFSDIGEGEGVRPENFFEVRTNDGDKISNLIPYNGTCLVFKERSFHRLTGDNPQNFSLSEVSDQYGCLSNRAAVVWNDYVWWLDRKGVMQFNGANLDCVSNEIEPILLRMNVDAAKDSATAIHDRLNNQVKFSIPVDGSTLNNMTIVYDYLAKAWTTEIGYKPSVNAMIRGRLDKPVHFYGGYTGTLHHFGASFLGDNSQGMTCLIKTRFFNAGSNSIEKQFRRLFLDCQTQSVTAPIQINIRQDYGSSVQVTRTMYQAPFQSRIDFGLMAKAVNFEMTASGESADLQVNGFTVESREQRRV